MTKEALEILRESGDTVIENFKYIIHIYESMFNDEKKLNERLENVENTIASFKGLFLKDEYLSIIHKTLQLVKYYDKTSDDEIGEINNIQKEIEKYAKDKGIDFNPIYDYGLLKW